MDSDVKVLIDSIFRDAKAHNITASSISKRAKLAKNLLSIWRKGGASPTLESFVRARRALDELINEKA